MRPINQQVRESIINIDDIKDQLNLLVHEIRSFSARIDEMSSSPLGLKYGFDCSYDYFFRIRDIKSKTKGTKTPNKPVVLLVLMILECLKSGPRSERDIKDFVTEKCRKCGIKATNRGTIAGANLEISSACNILGAMGILEQAHVNERIEPEFFINPSLPEPPADEKRAEDYLSLLAFRWSKIIESVVTESQTMEIASSTSINQEKTSALRHDSSHSVFPQQLHQFPSATLLPSHSYSYHVSQTDPTSTTLPNRIGDSSTNSTDDMDFVDILMQSSEHLDLPSQNHETKPIFQTPQTTSSFTSQRRDIESSLQYSFLNPQNNVPTTNNSSSFPVSNPYSTQSEHHKVDRDNINQYPLSPGSNSRDPRPPLPQELLGEIKLVANMNSMEAHDGTIQSTEANKSLSAALGKVSMTRKSASSTKIWRLKRQLKVPRVSRKSLLTEENLRLDVNGDRKAMPVSEKPKHDTGSGKAYEGSGEEESILDDEITRFLFSPESLLEKWGENSFHHHASMEVEEKLLRRVASQCSLGFRNKDVSLTPSHVGTRYLDSHFDTTNTEVVPMISLVNHPPPAIPSSSASSSKQKSQTKGGKPSVSRNQIQHQLQSQTEPQKVVVEVATSVDQSLIPSLPSIDSFDGGNDVTIEVNKEYDFAGNTSAQMLIDKVKKSKRHRGVCLANHVNFSSSTSGLHQFTSTYLNNMKNICHSTVQGYWTVGAGSEHSMPSDASQISSGSKRVPLKGVNGSILSNNHSLSSAANIPSSEGDEKIMTVAEYLKYCQQQNIHLNNQYLHSSHFDSNQLLLNGAYPNVSMNLFKRYVPPISIIDYEQITAQEQFSHAKPIQATKASNFVTSPICYPDLMITTLEIPWNSIVSEFQIVRSEEMGLSFIATDQLPSTLSTDMIELHRSQSTSEIPPPSPHYSQLRPRSSSSNMDPSNNTSNSKIVKSKSQERIHLTTLSLDINSSSNPNPPQVPPTVTSTIFRCRSVSEVYAPSFKELSTDSPNFYSKDRDYYTEHPSPLNEPTSFGGGSGDNVETELDPSSSNLNDCRTRRNHQDQARDAAEFNPVEMRSNFIDDQAESGGLIVDNAYEESDEDTADEVYLAKHDHVLRTMREKWALMQQLKLETRREISANASQNGILTGNKRSFPSFQSPYKLQKLSSFSSDVGNGLTLSRSNSYVEESITQVTEGTFTELSPQLNSRSQEDGSPLEGRSNGATGTLLGGLISYNNRKRSYSLLNINKIGQVASQLVNGGTSSASSNGGLDAAGASVPVTMVKKRGRPPKIQKTSHLHYGKINT